MENCCVCKASVSSSEEKKRRKKLPGVSCKRARDALNAELEDAFSLHLEDFKDTAGASSYLCRSCDVTLNTIMELQNRLSQLKTRIKGYIMRFQPVSTMNVPGKKRTSSLASTASPPKRARLGDDPAGMTVTSQSHSPAVSVKIDYPSGPQVFAVHTPGRKTGIKQYTRRNYRSLASTVVTSPITSDRVLREIAKTIKDEMKSLASMERDSILRDNIEAVKHFSWETIYLELEATVPTLIQLLRYLVRKPLQSKPFIACLASQLLKDGHPKLGLMQRAVSMFLYGNGSSKQVYTSLNHLNICMSHSGTLKLLKTLCVDHDVNVHYWSDSLKKHMQKLEESTNPADATSISDLDVAAFLAAGDSDHEMTPSPTAPIYSPVSADYEEEDSSAGGSSKNVDSNDSGGNTDAEDEGMAAEQPESAVAMDTDITTSQQEVPVPDDSPRAPKPEWNGFKIVGDNVDKNVRPSFQRLTHQTKSLHHFQSYAVKDRVDWSQASDVRKSPTAIKLQSSSFLMTEGDWDRFKGDCHVLISRILVQHMEKFKDKSMSKEVVWHIPSRYSDEMSRKSEIVPLGVQLYNENKLDEMAKILEEFHSYIPSIPSTQTVTLGDGTTRSVDNAQFFHILMGGDQLTVARARGTAALRATHDAPTERLSGIVPVVEDWHARLTLMKVIWKQLFSTKSTKERGTMNQIRNFISRSGVPTKPEKNMKAAEDFLLLLLHAHVIAAATKISDFESGYESVTEVATCIVNTFLLLPSCSSVEEDVDGPSCSSVEEDVDGVNTYARELMTLALIWHNFHDAIREGDGERIILCWKTMLPLFKLTNRRNYVKEAVNLLLQCSILSDRKVGQLLWSRCVNTQGRVGCNIPCDLHQEHLNRTLKSMLRSLGANLTSAAVVRAGKSLSTVHNICEQFENQTTSTAAASPVHNAPGFGKDFRKVLSLLMEEDVMEAHENRRHKTFTFTEGLLQGDNCKSLEKRIKSLIIAILAAS